MNDDFEQTADDACREAGLDGEAQEISDLDVEDLEALHAAGEPADVLPEPPAEDGASAFEATVNVCPVPGCGAHLVTDWKTLVCPQDPAHFNEEVGEVVDAPEAMVGPVPVPGMTDDDVQAFLAGLARSPMLFAALMFSLIDATPVQYNVVPHPTTPDVWVLLIGTPTGPQVTMWRRDGIEKLRSKLDKILGDRGDLVTAAVIPEGLVIPGARS